MQYIDLTHTFTSLMPVYPGDPASSLEEISKGGIVDHVLNTAMHVGTHMDAPLHMVPGGKRLSEFPPEKFFGRGVIINAHGKTSADVELLSGVDIKQGDIVLVCFGWSKKFLDEDYYNKYPEVSREFVQALIGRGISIVGMDTPSPDRSPYIVHKMLLEKEILIIENLNNLEALIGFPNFEVIALPAKFNTDSAPCRVVARIA